LHKGAFGSYAAILSNLGAKTMGFETLLGNDRLKHNLTASLRQGKTAHFYLISGPRGSGKKTLAGLLAAAAMCESPDAPCLGCSHCRKVLSGVHPDVITVSDPEHKTVPVRIIRQMRDDVFIRPNEGNRKIYIFPQEMGIEGQNALLKVLEEPPSYGLFLLLTDNAEKILPTVRSRCVELALQPLEENLLKKQLHQEFPKAQSDAIAAAIARSGGFWGQARSLLAEGAQEAPQTASLIRALCERDELLLTRTLVPLEKWKRDQLIPLLQQWTEILEGALAIRCGGTAVSSLSAQLAASRSGPELLEAIRHLQKCTEYAQGNVSCAAISGYLQWMLR
jgi:DNA polymerase-3 subunit delta'